MGNSPKCATSISKTTRSATPASKRFWIRPTWPISSTSIEGRYRVRPKWDAAARLDHLGFSDVTGTTRTTTWDANVTRLEVGGGYRVLRNLQLKLSVQRNLRDGGRVRRSTIGATQLVVWF